MSDRNRYHAYTATGALIGRGSSYARLRGKALAALRGGAEYVTIWDGPIEVERICAET